MAVRVRCLQSKWADKQLTEVPSITLVCPISKHRFCRSIRALAKHSHRSRIHCLRKPRFTPRPILCLRARKCRFGPMTRSTRQRLPEGKPIRPKLLDDVLEANGDVVTPHGSNAQIVIRSASKQRRSYLAQQARSGSDN
jgi:hypothetical protein